MQPNRHFQMLYNLTVTEKMLSSPFYLHVLLYLDTEACTNNESREVK